MTFVHQWFLARHNQCFHFNSKKKWRRRRWNLSNREKLKWKGWERNIKWTKYIIEFVSNEIGIVPIKKLIPSHLASNSSRHLFLWNSSQFRFLLENLFNYMQWNISFRIWSRTYFICHALFSALYSNVIFLGNEAIACFNSFHIGVHLSSEMFNL